MKYKEFDFNKVKQKIENKIIPKPQIIEIPRYQYNKIIIRWEKRANDLRFET